MSSSTGVPVYGLILTGGRSSRMQRDKAALTYLGQSQLERVHALLERHVERVFVSVNPRQTDDATRAGKALIVDSVEGEGPIVGIQSALAAHPHAAWLVLACDLPFLSDAALAQLLSRRDPTAPATAFLSTHDGLPEPLCAVWEPSAGAALAAYRAGGGKCPRKFLSQHGARLIDADDRRALDNVNTPADYAHALATLDATKQLAKLRLTVQYFALMREQAGRSREIVQTAAATPAELYAELQPLHGFTLQREQLKVAVNGEFAEWSLALEHDDTVVFLPPVADG